MKRTIIAVEMRVVLDQDVTAQHALAMIDGLCSILAKDEGSYDIKAGSSQVELIDGEWKEVTE
jgi:hypothetical protein